MGHDRPQLTLPDLLSNAPEQRHVLPKNLPNAVKHLTDRELDQLVAVSLEEARRRGRSPIDVQADKTAHAPTHQSSHTRQMEDVSLPQGRINAVRAAFKAGLKPSTIARQFGISQSDVRKVVASMKATSKP
jgi:predicted DNA-binding protein (UPF0251 family)